MISTLEEGRRRWKCCCGCHVTTGAMIIGVLSLIGTTMQAGYAFVKTANTGEPAPAIIASCTAVLVACAFILLVIGLGKKIANFLIMQLVVQVIMIIELVAKAIILVAALAPSLRQADSTIILGLGLAICLVAIALQTWFFVIVLRAYQYLKLKMLQAAAMVPMEPVVIYSNGDDEAPPPAYAYCVVDQKEPLRQA